MLTRIGRTRCAGASGNGLATVRRASASLACKTHLAQDVDEGDPEAGVVTAGESGMTGLEDGCRSWALR
jgi:hypothetical protein